VILEENANDIQKHKGIKQNAFMDMFRVTTYFNRKRFQPSINNFIKGFGEKFESYNSEELLEFTEILAQAGLPQTDIFTAVNEQLQRNETFKSAENMKFENSHAIMIN